jgi:hypothetical protein
LDRGGIFAARRHDHCLLGVLLPTELPANIQRFQLALDISMICGYMCIMCVSLH